MSTRIELPDKFCQGVEVPHPYGKGKRYRADPRQPGSVVVDNPQHARLFARSIGGFASDSSRAGFAGSGGQAAAASIECGKCGHERWAWVERCKCGRTEEA